MRELARDSSAHAPPRHGTGRLRFARSAGASVLAGCVATSPLQVLAPRRRGRSAWAVLASHGGGLVAGDALDVAIEVGEQATAVVSTQAQTKVYRCPGRAVTSQRLLARVGENAVLAMVPDAVSLFGGARYEQRQRFEVARGAALLLADGVVAGRAARGERWRFEQYRTSTEVRVEGRLVFGDALLLEGSAGGELADRLAPFEAYGFVLALGPALAGAAGAIGELAAALPAAPGRPLLATSSPVPGGLLVRFAARRAECGAELVRQAIAASAGAIGEIPSRW